MSGGIGLALGALTGVALYRLGLAKSAATADPWWEGVGKGVMVAGPFVGLMLGWAIGG